MGNAPAGKRNRLAVPEQHSQEITRLAEHAELEPDFLLCLVLREGLTWARTAYVPRLLEDRAPLEELLQEARAEVEDLERALAAAEASSLQQASARHRKSVRLQRPWRRSGTGG